MKKFKKIRPSATVLVVDSMQRFRFFRRLAASLQGERDFVFFCSEPLAAIVARCLGHQAIYVRRESFDMGPHSPEDRVKQCIEVLNDDIQEQDATADFRSTTKRLQVLLDEKSIDTVVVWNGQQLFARAAALAANQEGVSTRFLEIANLPGKLFVDPMGVNASSSLYENPGVLDALPPYDESLHLRWIANYEDGKSAPPPQSQVSIRQKLASLINMLLKKASGGVVQRSLYSLRRSIPIADHPESETLNLEQLRLLRYVFLPLQVSGDTQLKLHSAIDNLAAIRIAHSKAVELDAELLVKIHPAEFNSEVLRQIDILRMELGFRLISGSITNVIKHAELVVTINSTVGLEALIYGKQLMTLGSAFYKDFDQLRLRSYIHRYLLPADYFGRDPIDPGAARRIISNA